MARSRRGYYSGGSHGAGGSGGSSGGDAAGCGFVLLGLAIFFFWKEILCILAIGAVVVGIVYCLIRFHREIFYGIGVFFRGLWRLLVWLWNLCFGRHGHTHTPIENQNATIINGTPIEKLPSKTHREPHPTKNNGSSHPCALEASSDSSLPVAAMQLPPPPIPKEISLKLPITVKDFAMALNVTVNDVILKFMAMGIFVVEDQNIGKEYVEKVCAQYGTHLNILEVPTLQPPAIDVTQTIDASTTPEGFDNRSPSHQEVNETIPTTNKKTPIIDAETRLAGDKSRNVKKHPQKKVIKQSEEEILSSSETKRQHQHRKPELLFEAKSVDSGDKKQVSAELEGNLEDSCLPISSELQQQTEKNSPHCENTQATPVQERIEPDSCTELNNNEDNSSSIFEESLRQSPEQKAEIKDASDLLAEQTENRSKTFQLSQSATKENTPEEMPITPSSEMSVPRKKKKSPFWR